MGNIFSFFFKNNINLEDSLLEPLINEEPYASLLEINTLNSQVNILEQTTQNSLINISKDVKHLFIEIDNLKNRLIIIENNHCQSIYHDVNDINNDSSNINH
jgi:hypothetical protein